MNFRHDSSADTQYLKVKLSAYSDGPSLAQLYIALKNIIVRYIGVMHYYEITLVHFIDIVLLNKQKIVPSFLIINISHEIVHTKLLEFG